MTVREMARHFEDSVRYRIVIRQHKTTVRTKFENTAEGAARFVESLGVLGKGQAVYVYICRSLALAVRAQ